MTNPDNILDYWFNGLNDDQTIDKKSETVRRWFTKDEKIDQEIRNKFEPDLIRARNGEYKSWENSAQGQLALIILFDQFSRNMYRNTPKMFETDSLSLRLTLRSLSDKTDSQLQMMERLFLYMPLMHAEDLEIQKLSLQCFKNLVNQSKEINIRNAPYYEYSFGFAQSHHDIIEKFGRFPHRNSILERTSTPEESEFLKKPGSAF